jgi:hypothetical protein
MRVLTFEISLKPFCSLDQSAMMRVCMHAFRQWDALIRSAEEIAILLWAADGSEILEYAGDLDAQMEWARYLGNSNPHKVVPNDPEKKSLHSRNYLYRPDAGLITYRRLADIVQAWREAAKALPSMSGKRLRVGLPFDPGGEFAPSEFKYKRHPEICLANTMGPGSFVCCYAKLHADDRPYAGFPHGIPEGTGIGTFLGRQFRHLAQDIGFDYLWLSNGFGFGMETWATTGPLFDGEAFSPDQAPEVRDRILAFWKDIRRELPASIGLETRGTNLGTATDLASDATPLRELYEGGFDFAPPPNSPWAALDGDFGIELAGYMTRIAELPPGKGIPFRYYIHDPWWFNTPWLDRYEGQPHDIYLPLSIGRVNSAGGTESACTLNLITLDDSYGRMPDEVPNQASPHLLRAWSERPDCAGPFVWLYPFDEMHDAMFGPDPLPERLFHVDWFMREAINDGAPINTIMSTRSFAALGKKASKALGGRILISPSPFNEDTEARLLDWVDGGGELLVYGPLAQAPQLRSRLGLEEGSPLTDQMQADRFELNSILSAGPLTDVPAGGSSREDGAFAKCSSSQHGGTRILATHRDVEGGGSLTWLRAPLPLKIVPGIKLPVPADAATTFPLSSLVRQALARHGWHFFFRGCSRAQRHPVVSLHRHANGWLFSGYSPDTTMEAVMRTPFGVPLLLGTEVKLKDGQGAYRFPRAWRHECRVFVEQDEGVVGCIERHPAQIGVVRRFLVSGLKNATLRFFPPPHARGISAYLNIKWPNITGETIPLIRCETPQGLMYETSRSATGSVLFSWGGDVGADQCHSQSLSLKPDIQPCEVPEYESSLASSASNTL